MRSFIEGYINIISISDIKKFAFKNKIDLSDDEASILAFYLKNNWEDILYGDPSPIIDDIKHKFDSNKCSKLINLFYFYKNKYKDYL